MNVFVKNITHRFGILLKKHLVGGRVETCVTRIAKGNEIINLGVPVRLIVSQPASVDVVDMGGLLTSAPNALEAVTLEGLIMGSTAVKRALLGPLSTFARAVYLDWAGFNALFAAHLAEKRVAAIVASLEFSTGRMKGLATFLTRRRACPDTLIQMLRLTWLTPDLFHVICAKLRAAYLTVLHVPWSFHGYNIRVNLGMSS